MSDKESLALDDEVRAATDLHTTAVTMNQHDHVMSTLPPPLPLAVPCLFNHYQVFVDYVLNLLQYLHLLLPLFRLQLVQGS